SWTTLVRLPAHGRARQHDHRRVGHGPMGRPLPARSPGEPSRTRRTFACRPQGPGEPIGRPAGGGAAPDGPVLPEGRRSANLPNRGYVTFGSNGCYLMPSSAIFRDPRDIKAPFSREWAERVLSDATPRLPWFLQVLPNGRWNGRAPKEPRSVDDACVVRS